MSDEGGEWLGVEAAIAEAQTSVHAVSSQLQSFLPDVILMENQILFRLTRSDPPTGKYHRIGEKVKAYLRP